MQFKLESVLDFINISFIDIFVHVMGAGYRRQFRDNPGCKVFKEFYIISTDNKLGFELREEDFYSFSIFSKYAGILCKVSLVSPFWHK